MENTLTKISQWNATLARSPIIKLAVIACLLAISIVSPAEAHGVADGDKGYIQETTGFLFAPFVYLGAKHMVTGYDHLLFLFGVIFFLYRMKDIGIYVTMFAVGHSLTLLFGVLANIDVRPTAAIASRRHCSAVRRRRPTVASH